MERCLEKVIHEDAVRKVLSQMPAGNDVRELATLFKALGDPSRLGILLALCKEELCVCDISTVCSLSESAVSHQLRTLRALKLVRNRRVGKIVFYRLDDRHVEQLIMQSLSHVQEPTDG